MSLPYYKRFPRDFLDGTIGMSLEEKGAYSVMLDLAAVHDGIVPANEHYIAAWCGASVRKIKIVLPSLERAGKVLRSPEGLTLPLFDQWSAAAARSPLAQALRLAVFERDGYQCQYCQTKDGPFEIDHVYPVSRGGRDDFDNLVCACVPCNRSKGAKLVSEWKCEA